MSNIRHSSVRPIESKKSDPIMRRIEFATFDPTECTRLVGITKERVYHILHETLGMRKLNARWAPRMLTMDQKRVHMNIYI